MVFDSNMDPVENRWLLEPYCTTVYEYVSRNEIGQITCQCNVMRNWYIGVVQDITRELLLEKHKDLEL